VKRYYSRSIDNHFFHFTNEKVKLLIGEVISRWKCYDLHK